VQIKDALHQQFPHLEISGGNYPTPASKVLLAQCAQAVQFSLIGVALLGDYLFTHVLNYPAGGPFPPLYEQIREKKMFVGLGAWIVGNGISQGLTSTGAFEVYYNGQIVSSKLAPTSAAFSSSHGHAGSNAVPSLQFIVQQMHRIDPSLSSRRVHHGHPTNAPPRKASTKPISASQDDDDVNRDVRDLSYED